jgi:hypothetical protein
LLTVVLAEERTFDIDFPNTLLPTDFSQLLLSLETLLPWSLPPIIYVKRPAREIVLRHDVNGITIGKLCQLALFTRGTECFDVVRGISLVFDFSFVPELQVTGIFLPSPSIFPKNHELSPPGTSLELFQCLVLGSDWDIHPCHGMCPRFTGTTTGNAFQLTHGIL